MKRFRFSLEELMELRRFREKQAEMDLSQKAGRVSLIERELVRIASERDRQYRDRSRAASAGESGVGGGMAGLKPGPGTRAGTVIDFADFLAGEQYLIRLDSERSHREEELVKAELEREESRQRWTLASRDTKVLEEMEKGERDSWRKENEKRETLEVDDIVNGRRTRLALADVEVGENAALGEVVASGR